MTKSQKLFLALLGLFLVAAAYVKAPAGFHFNPITMSGAGQAGDAGQGAP